jgi:hypothetical protein
VNEITLLFQCSLDNRSDPDRETRSDTAAASMDRKFVASMKHKKRHIQRVIDLTIFAS